MLEARGVAVGVAHCDIGPDRRVEKPGLLRDEGDLTAQSLDVQVSNVDSIPADAAPIGLVEPEEQRQQGALTGPGRPDDRQDLTRRDIQRDIVEDGGCVTVGEADVVDCDAGAQR